jgi:hypothetical protein
MLLRKRLKSLRVWVLLRSGMVLSILMYFRTT